MNGSPPLFSGASSRYLYKEGYPVEEMYFIIKGRIQMEDWAGEELLAMWTIFPPDSFGAYFLLFASDSFIAVHLRYTST